MLRWQHQDAVGQANDKLPYVIMFAATDESSNMSGNIVLRCARDCINGETFELIVGHATPLSHCETDCHEL